MPTFWIGGSLPLLRAATVALLGERRPQVSVGGEPPADLAERWPEAGVALGLEDRWLFVSPTIGPDENAAQALSAGAVAVLNLSSNCDEFDRAFEAVLRGERSFVPVEMVQWLADRAVRANGAALPVRLTAREGEVLGLLARGYSNEEIADTLTISVNTVRTHLHALAVKLEASSRAKIVANARARGLPEAADALDGGPHGRAAA